MSSNPVPTFTPVGFVNDSINKLDALLSDMFVADGNQSQLYHGNVLSIPYIVQEYGSDISGLATSLQSRIKQYLMKYYTDVSVDARVTTSPDNPSVAGVTIQLFIEVVDNNSTYSQTITRTVVGSTERMAKIIKLNN